MKVGDRKTKVAGDCTRSFTGEKRQKKSRGALLTVGCNMGYCQWGDDIIVKSKN